MPLVPCLSLWLDELLQLEGLRGAHLTQIPEYAARNAGGVPAGYFLTFSFISAFGYSIYAARLPSLIFSMLACAGVFHLARRANIRRPLIAVCLFAVFPLQLRYAIEARPYSVALCLSIWLTVVFLKLHEELTFKWGCLYFLLTLAAAYTQPYSMFVPLSHLAYCVLFGWKRIRNIAVVAASIGCSGLLFVPWLLYAIPFWRAEIAVMDSPPTYGYKQALLVIKELVGSGYAASLVTMFLAGYGLSRVRQECRQLSLVTVVVVVFGVFIANMTFGYFLAIRQMIYVLTPLSLLAAAGVERLWTRNRWLAATAAGTLLCACSYSNAWLFWKPREDWQAATERLKVEAARGACIVIAEERSVVPFRFFWETISERICQAHETEFATVVLATSRYEVKSSKNRARFLLEQRGWKHVTTYHFGGPELIVYLRTVGQQAVGLGRSSDLPTSSRP